MLVLIMWVSLYLHFLHNHLIPADHNQLNSSRSIKIMWIISQNNLKVAK